MMAEVTNISVTNVTPGNSGTILALEFTKANATDTVTIPEGFGKTVVWADVCIKSSLVKDPATAVSGLTVTLSQGTGVMKGLFMVE